MKILGVFSRSVLVIQLQNAISRLFFDIKKYEMPHFSGFPGLKSPFPIFEIHFFFVENKATWLHSHVKQVLGKTILIN